MTTKPETLDQRLDRLIMEAVYKQWAKLWKQMHPEQPNPKRKEMV